MAQPPSFPFYPADWLTGTLVFTPAEDGVYLRCLCHQWTTGGVPAEAAGLAAVMRVSPAEAKKLWSKIGHKFTRGVDGMFRNDRLERQRAEKQKYHEAQAENGKRSAAARAQRNSNGGSTAVATMVEPPLQPSGQPEPNLSLALALAPVPTEPTDAREAAAPAKPKPYEHALIRKRNLSARWEGPIFDLPESWAQKMLRASNGGATDADVPTFGQALTARLEREGAAAPVGRDFLSWLDAEWASWRSGRQEDARSQRGIEATREFIDQQKAIAATIPDMTAEERRALLRPSRTAAEMPR